MLNTNTQVFSIIVKFVIVENNKNFKTRFLEDKNKSKNELKIKTKLLFVKVEIFEHSQYQHRKYDM